VGLRKKCGRHRRFLRGACPFGVRRVGGLAERLAVKVADLQVLRKRLMGLEPTTFCMASRTWDPEPPKRGLQNGDSELYAVGDAVQLLPRNRGSFRTETGLGTVPIRPRTALTNGTHIRPSSRFAVRDGAFAAAPPAPAAARVGIGSVQTPAPRPQQAPRGDVGECSVSESDTAVA
jgi:hypothetical protein